MKKSTEEFTKELLNKWSLTLTSAYEGAHKLVIFTCINNHENTAIATNVLQRGYKCKECLVGHKVVPKIEWDDLLITQVLLALETKTTKEVAELFNTTVSSINNMLSKNEESNPRDRLTRLDLTSKLLEQNRTLIKQFGDLATVKCSSNHQHTQEWRNILYKNTGCPSCFHSNGISNIEKEILNYIQEVYKGWIITNDRKMLEGKELDIILPDVGLAIEVNGTYWHSEEKVGKNYHLNKTELVEAEGYQLLHIKDYDWINHQQIVKSIISSKLGLTTKIFARKCVMKQISFPTDFLNTNHIQGAGQPTSLNYGLYYNEELICVATFSKPRFSNEANYELVRFCSKLNTTVVGGLSKLLSKINGSILSYASRDYSTGKGYLATNFKLIRKTQPSLEYYYKYTKLSRYKAQSIEDLSKYTKYYNSGNLVFIRSAN